jgi:hypothetical protein
MPLSQKWRPEWVTETAWEGDRDPGEVGHWLQ